MRSAWPRVVATLSWLWQQAVITARLAVGVPDYDNYLRHHRSVHAGLSAMSREEFYRERLQARYARGSGRCC